MVYIFWLGRARNATLCPLFKGLAKSQKSTKKGFLLLLYKIVIFAILNLGRPYDFIQHF